MKQDIRRLRKIEAELERKTAESRKLRQEIGNALRAGQQMRWPVDPRSSANDKHSSSES